MTSIIVTHFSDFEKDLLQRLAMSPILDLSTDNQGQIVIYTGLAETEVEEPVLVEFDPNAPEGTYHLVER